MEKNKKYKIISEGQQAGVSCTCKKYGISRTLYYRWLNRYKTHGIEGLDTIRKSPPINKTPSNIEESVLLLIKSYPSYGPREINYMLEEIGHKISESAVYNIMRRHNLSTKDKRISFAKNTLPASTNSPVFENINSGECWLFWTTALNSPKDTIPLYKYTLIDFKSKIACSRLYDHLSVENFLDLLTAAAIPVAQSMGFNTKYMYVFDDQSIPKKEYKAFMASTLDTLETSGFDTSIHFFKDDEVHGDLISVKNEYTHWCLSGLIPALSQKYSLDDIKITLQRNLRQYNIYTKFEYEDQMLSPLEYHSFITGHNRVLPLWAYIDRLY